MEKHDKNNLVDTAKVLFIYTIRHLIPLFSPQRRAVLAEIIGRQSLRGEKAHIIKDELKKLFGPDLLDKELNQITLRTLNNFRKDLFDTWCFPSLNPKNIKDFGYLEGKENLNKALEKGKGAIIAVSHFGLWKAILPVIGYTGYKVTQIAKSPLDFTGNKSSFVNNKVMEIEYQCEKSLPAKFIYLGQFLRPVYKSLANNEVVVISFDGVKGTKRLLTRLFNRDVHFSSGPVTLSLETGSPLLPAFIIRDKDERHKIKIEQELYMPESGGKEQIIQQVINNYALLLKDYIAKYPCHYAMFMYIALTHHIKGDPQVFL